MKSCQTVEKIAVSKQHSTDLMTLEQIFQEKWVKITCCTNEYKKTGRKLQQQTKALISIGGGSTKY